MALYVLKYLTYCGPVVRQYCSFNKYLLTQVKAYTPAVQNLCQSYDSKMKALLEDANFYISLPTEKSDDSETGAFDILSDKDALQVSYTYGLHIETAMTTVHGIY